MWITRFVQDLFPFCPVPIVGAPMAGHAGGKLAAQVCRAGALGFIGAGYATASEEGMRMLNEQIEVFRNTCESPTTPLSLGFVGHLSFRDAASWERLEQILRTHQPAVVQFFAPAIAQLESKTNAAKTNVELAHQYNAKVLAQVGTLREAREAVEAGVDGLIVQGSEAGGHGVRRELGSGTLSLAACVIDKFPDVPVIAAGGIVDGKTMAAALTLGCDGVVLGTRLCASQECMGNQSFKDRLVSADSCDDVVRTTVFDRIQNSYSETPWPQPYDSVGGLRNKMYETWKDRDDDLSKALRDKSSSIAVEYQTACKEGNADIAVVLAGEGVGLIDRIEPAYDIITRINLDAATIIRNASKRLLE